MNPAPDDREKRLIELFNEAKDLPSGEQRDQFLAQACGKDEQFRAELHSLLRAGHSAGDYLHGGPAISPQLEAEFARLKPEEPGDRIGHYKLLQQIGEGGFGTVWMAEQSEPVKRRVALKIIKLGMDTKEVVARFEQERQALAMMDHPNIARVFDAGVTPTGRPFFVMELVRGIKITDYCDEQSLSTEERVQLFIEICHAVQHAHQKGIIHRDLKPSNILITINDGEAMPKVIDFGVAKATQGRLSDATLFTKFEQMIGTPLYMSPEQAEMTSLDIDTRSDIFSLGVLLYELLTGRTPIDTTTMAQAGMDEIRRIIREVDPPRPSARVKTLAGSELTTAAKRRHTDPAKLPRSLRGDIDWIVMKCLEKDRKRRYETATGLAADLQRHLRNQVVIARPPTTAYLLSKLIKRNKLAVAAGLAIALSVLAGIFATGWQLVQTRKAEQRATALLDELRATAPAFAEQARSLAAKERFDDAIEKLDSAVKLRPDVADYLLAKADLLQCQLNLAKLADAALVYREALRVNPGLARAEASAKLCDELLAAKSGQDGKLSRKSLARLHLAMQQQQRPAAELMPVARLLGEEKKLIVDYWLARLKDLPVSGERSLKDRLTVRDDGQLALDLSGTKVTDLSPLGEAPLAVLNADRCWGLKDISALRGQSLSTLILSTTAVADLTPLREMHTLTALDVSTSHVTDLSPISSLRLKRLTLMHCAVSNLAPIAKMPLEEMSLRGTRVADLSPLIGMPIKSIDLTDAPVLDFSPLAELPLEKCYLQRNRIVDLSVFRGKPLKELALWACIEARNYAVLQEIETLELLLLPSEYRGLPAEDYAAIGALRDHPKLRQIGSEIMGGMGFGATGSKKVFWQDWDQEQAFVPGLRATGGSFVVTKRASGTYAVTMTGNKGLKDLSIFTGAPISELAVPYCEITDLTPLRGLPLRILGIASNPVSNLEPLQGMPLERLNASSTRVTDLSPLVGAPLKRLLLEKCENISDVGVLASIPSLEQLIIPVGAANVERLRELPKLRQLAYELTGSAPFDPAATAEQFWKDYESNRWITRLAHSGWKPKKLKRLNDGTWDLNFEDTAFSDLTLLAGAPISILHLKNSKVSDLGPLRGMQLRSLGLDNTAIADLEPLRGMPLKEITFNSTKVNDLRPLQGMKLETLAMGRTKVSDISVLRGMPLTSLRLHGCTELTDLSAIADAKALTAITLPPHAKNFEFLGAFPKLRRISFDESSSNYPDNTAAEFWKQPRWVRALRESGLMIKTLKEQANGTWEVDLSESKISDLAILHGTPVSYLHLWNTAVADLAPLRGMALKHLSLFNTKVADLNPLKGMPLEYLTVSGTKVADISVLRGMPLISLRLHDCTELTDLSPLADCKELKEVTLPPNATSLESLRVLQKLERIGIREDPKNYYLPEKTAAEFWKEYDEKRK